MGQTQSKKKGRLLYKAVSSGNLQRIQALRDQGADLEWMDKEGKTPLTLACTDQKLYDVAQILIHLGANVNAHRPASAGHAGTYEYHGWTPLYQAASSGLVNTVELLLSNGANYDTQRALGLARSRGFTYVVRAIESHICLFSGWMREYYSPTLLGFVGPQFLSRRVWVVIVPTDPTNAYCKFELIVYATKQDAQPRMVMAVPDLNVEEPEAMYPDTSVTICGKSTRTNSPSTTESITLAPSIEEGRQQLKWFCDACKGIPQPMHSPVLPQAVPSDPPPLTDDEHAQDGSYGQCRICVDAPCNAICLPCAHIAGCESCLTRIKSLNQGCPFCRTEILEVMRVYRT